MELSCLRRHRMAVGLLSASVVVAVAYCIMCNCKGWNTSEGSGMSAIWAAIYSGAEAALILIMDTTIANRPYQRAATGTLFLLPTFTFISFVSLATLGDIHGSVWYALATMTCIILLFGNPVWRRASHSGSASSTISDMEKGDSTQTSSGAGTSPGPSNEPSSCRAKCGRCCASCTLWTTLLLLCLFAVSTGVHNVLTSHEAKVYPAPGRRLSTAIASPVNRVSSTDMHLFCVGPYDSTKPTFLFEHGGGACSFSFYGAQQELAKVGRRSCAYDRPGFGWSDALPLGAASVDNYHGMLKTLLTNSGEAGPFIIVGHSVGVELSQVFAYKYPELISGVALLDGYPDYRMLLGWNEAQVKADDQRVCNILQITRALDATGLLRMATSNQRDFQPPDKAKQYASTYSNGRNWESQYREYCTSRGPSTTDYLRKAADASGYGAGHNPDFVTVRWPKLKPGVKVLVLSAGKTVAPAGKRTQYYTQAQAYNTSLSSSGDSKWVICPDPCDHGFPSARPEFLVTQLTGYFDI